MSVAPLTFLEKKWALGSGANDTLVRGAVQTSDRRNVDRLDKDTHRTISPTGRRTLLSLGRWLYWNVSTVRGTINEMVDLAVQSYIPQFEGADQAWGGVVENWLYEHDKICDVRGWPFSMSTYRKNLVRGVLIDGDVATALVKNEEGYPMIQVFPSHRIGSGFGESLVKGGPWDGARIIDGCILNDQGRVMAYRVLSDGDWSQTFQDVDARDIFLSYFVETPDQVRGVSTLGASVFDWQDVSDARRFHLISQKLGASIGLIETNEAGEADQSKKLLTRTSTNFGPTSTSSTTPATAVSTTASENIDGVSIRYHRAGSGSKLEAFRNDNPSANQAQFHDDVIREALHGIGWSFDYGFNPTKIGGAPMRVVVDRLNRKLDCLREEIVKPAQSRIDGYRIASVMDNPARTDKKTVYFPFNADWFKWSYQGPAKLTADAKYNSDVDLQERRAGQKTLSQSTAERGNYWRDTRAQNELEADDLMQRATRISKKHGISIELAISLLEKTDNNPIQAAVVPDPNVQQGGFSGGGNEVQQVEAQPMHFNIDARGPEQKRRSMKIKRDARGEMIGIEEI